MDSEEKETPYPEYCTCGFPFMIDPITGRCMDCWGKSGYARPADDSFDYDQPIQDPMSITDLSD